MKVSEFRKLIREEVRKVMNEAAPEAYSFKELTDLIKTWFESGGKPGSTAKLLIKIGFLTKDGKSVDILRPVDATRNYKTTDNKTLEDVFDWWRNYKRNYSPGKSTKVNTSGKVPSSGKKLNDYDLTDNKYIRPEDMDEWFELLSDEGSFNPSKFTKIANSWLKDNGYAFQMANASSKDDGETIIWTIK